MCSRSTEVSRARSLDATVPATPSIAARSAFTSARTRRDGWSLPSDFASLSSAATRPWITSASGVSVEWDRRRCHLVSPSFTLFRKRRQRPLTRCRRRAGVRQPVTWTCAGRSRPEDLSVPRRRRTRRCHPHADPASPSPYTALWWKKYSFPASSLMNPNPFRLVTFESFPSSSPPIL